LSAYGDGWRRRWRAVRATVVQLAPRRRQSTCRAGASSRQRRHRHGVHERSRCLARTGGW
jgi:hypothetical protein